MIIDAVGVIFMFFCGILIILLLIPVIIALFMFFKLQGNSVTLKSLWEGAINYIKILLQNFGSKQTSTKTNKPHTENNIEDAEFREVE